MVDKTQPFNELKELGSRPQKMFAPAPFCIVLLDFGCMHPSFDGNIVLLCVFLIILPIQRMRELAVRVQPKSRWSFNRPIVFQSRRRPKQPPKFVFGSVATATSFVRGKRGKKPNFWPKPMWLFRIPL